MTSLSPFTNDDIQKWAAFGPKLFEKPTSPEQLAALQERSKKISAMKRRLCQQLNDKQNWSERAIERALNNLVLEKEKQQSKEAENGNNRNDGDPRLIRPEYTKDNRHPDNIMDHRPEGGPLLEYLWSVEEPLKGQTLYLGGEVGADGKIYCIPGHASRVLVIDDAKKQIYPIGPELTSNGRQYKWLRGIVVGHLIYGLPCHAEDILRIDTLTGEISKIPIPYEELYESPEEAKEERKMIWKYHGGDICPLDDCIYAIPQRAHQVLKLDPKTEKVTMVGPKFKGRCKWYGGILGKQDGAIYGIPQNASGVLRITPDSVTVHGDFGTENHKWHGGAAASNGVIVSVPANANTVLCITPGEIPKIEEIGSSTVIRGCGRHRDDGKYKYLGAMCGTDGHVYVFPCASEYVLQVNTVKLEARNVGPNLRDSGMETVHQNKWQNGLTCVQEKCVYGITLSGHTLLRIDCSKNTDDDDNEEEKDDVRVTTWLLPPPRRDCRDKFEGGVMTASGVMYTVPNNHKGVLRIEPANLGKL